MYRSQIHIKAIAPNFGVECSCVLGILLYKKNSQKFISNNSVYEEFHQGLAV